MRIASLLVTTLLFGGVVLYTIYLLLVGTLQIDDSFGVSALVAGCVLCAVVLLIGAYATFLADRLNKPKITFVVLGIILILIGAYVFTDNASTGVYLSDVVRLLGVYTIVGGLAGFIGQISEGSGSSTRRVKNVEIIEV